MDVPAQFLAPRWPSHPIAHGSEGSHLKRALSLIVQPVHREVLTLSRRFHFDVWPEHKEKLRPEEYLIHVAPLDEWLVLFSTVAVLLLVDTFIIRRAGGGGFKSHAGGVAFWVGAGALYNIYFAWRYGEEDALDWCTGFLLEYMLSIDNLFVFLLIFKVYKTPPQLMQKALFFGIAGGVIARVVIFTALGTVLHVIHWVRIVFGAVLIFSGVQAVQDDDGEEDVTKTYGVQILRWFVGTRLLGEYDLQGRLFVRGADGRLCMTMTVFVIVCLEMTDMLFAVDSVTAKVAQIPNQYIAYSSSVMAVFGLRALFFVVKDLVDYFDLVKYGICIILVFVGVQLMMSPFLHLESGTVCIVIASVFTVSLSASTARKILSQGAGKSVPSVAEVVGGARKHEAG